MAKKLRSYSRTLWMYAALIILVAFCCFMAACDEDGKATKNRVPTLAQYADQAEQSAKDAKAAADSVAQTKKDIDAAVDKLNGVQRDSNGELKEGRPETTSSGIVSEFGTYKIESDQSTNASDDYYLGFTFTDHKGFTKRFFPVCPNSTVKIGNSTAFLYHWRHYQNTTVGHRGCYQIDGQQAQ